jgi:hypothetical protein
VVVVVQAVMQQAVVQVAVLHQLHMLVVQAVLVVAV